MTAEAVEAVDVAVVGAGAAGLFAAIWAARRCSERGIGARVVAFDGAKKLGAKILVAGGGRCNVTHHAVDETAYAGSSRNAIRNVLRAYGVDETVAFFRALGVELKREDTGKLFPTTDRARTVLDALLGAAEGAGVEIRHPWRVAAVDRDADGFLVRSASGVAVRTRRVVLCTGGLALPRSGSDGAGYGFARALGHTVTPLVSPALVPLLLNEGCWVRELSGIAVPAEVSAHTASGKRLAAFRNPALCTHFGVSGPAVLDASRYYLAEAHASGSARLRINWLGGESVETLDQRLVAAASSGEKRGVWRFLGAMVPDRMAQAFCDAAGVEASTPLHALTKQQRRALCLVCCAYDAPVVGDRGYTHAEVTAGGVPLSEVVIRTMESRVCPGLHLAGEILDVDGRIGGFNFQWAWSSGWAAGRGAADGLGV